MARRKARKTRKNPGPKQARRNLSPGPKQTEHFWYGYSYPIDAHGEQGGGQGFEIGRGFESSREKAQRAAYRAVQKAHPGLHFFYTLTGTSKEGLGQQTLHPLYGGPKQLEDLGYWSPGVSRWLYGTGLSSKAEVARYERYAKAITPIHEAWRQSVGLEPLPPTGMELAVGSPDAWSLPRKFWVEDDYGPLPGGAAMKSYRDYVFPRLEKVLGPSRTWPYPIGLGIEPGRKAFVELWLP